TISEKKSYIKKCSENVILAAELSSRLADAVNSVGRSSEEVTMEERLEKERIILNNFEKNYQKMLENVEITLFQGDKSAAQEVKIDKDYIPTYRGQYLKKFASASDQSRIILPYILSVLKTSADSNGNHLGFSILDEPIQ